VHPQRATMHRLHLVIRGRVQGIGFRAFVVRRATELEVGGWVRNREDGAVEVEAAGSRAALERLLTALRRGPDGARVIGVEAARSERDSSPRAFRVRG